MVLAASIDGEPSLLAVDPNVPAGRRSGNHCDFPIRSNHTCPSVEKKRLRTDPEYVPGMMLSALAGISTRIHDPPAGIGPRYNCSDWLCGVPQYAFFTSPLQSP